jgi:Tfp pilus assembly protein PilO
MIRHLSELVALAKRYPFRGFCLALSTILLDTSVILWIHLRTLTALQHKKQTEGEAVTATLISGPQTRDELAYAKETTRRIASTLITEENLTDNVNYFYKLEEISKAHLDDLRPLNVPSSEAGTLYQRIPFSLKASGTFPEVAAFIQALETGPRLAAINSFSFRKRVGGPLVVVDLNLDLLGKK